MKLNFKKWIAEIERDLLALGSIIFYFLVIARALVGPFWILFTQLVTAAVIFLIFEMIIKDFEKYIARGLILTGFTNLYYESILFLIFSSIILLLMMISSFKLGNEIKKIMIGIFIGTASSISSYFGTLILDYYIPINHP